MKLALNLMMSMNVWIWSNALESSIDGENHLGIVLHNHCSLSLITIIIIMSILLLIIAVVVVIIIILILIMITSTISSGKAKTGAPIFRPQLIAYFAFSRFSCYWDFLYIHIGIDICIEDYKKWPRQCCSVCPQLECSRQHQVWCSRSGRWWVGRCRWQPCPWSSWLCGSSHTLASVKGQVLLVKTVFWDFCFSGWKCRFWDVAVCAILPFHLPIWKGTPLRQWWGPSSARTRCEPSSTARSTPASGSCFPPRCLGLWSRYW